MQKALDQMNLQLHHVISDITGLTGVSILEAILAGERNPHTLAGLRDRRIKASADTIAKSLVGDYRREHFFTLRQSLTAFRQYQELIAACDCEIAEYLEAFESKMDPPPGPASPSRDEQKPSTSGVFNLRTHLDRIFGVDLTKVPGIQILTAQTLLAEIGPDLSRFFDGPAFACWLGLCPDNRIPEGKCYCRKPARSRIEPPQRTALPRYRSIAANLFSDTSIAGCAPNSGPRRQSRPRRTNWHASFIT
jgi:transposase